MARVTRGQPSRLRRWRAPARMLPVRRRSWKRKPVRLALIGRTDLSIRLPLVLLPLAGYPPSVTSSQGSSWRLSLPGQLPLVAIPLIVLKLAGILGWSWWWVLAPLWSSVVIFVALIGGLLLLLIRSQRPQV
jgi:hypothetical protein